MEVGSVTKAALWARVSSSDGSQTNQNQLDVLRQWATDRDLEVVTELITEDSAWANGNGVKGREFDKSRDELLNGARLGQYTVVLVWAIDRLSRRGIEDTLATMRRLYEQGCDIWSHEEGWLATSEPRMRELLVSFMAYMAEQESSRRSERIKLGMARARAEGRKIGGRPKGIKETRPRRRRAPQPKAPPPEWMAQAQAMYDEVDGDGKPVHTAEAIARSFGSNVKSMYRHLNRNGPGGKARNWTPPAKLTEEEIAKAQAMYDEPGADGAPIYTVAQIAAQFGLTPKQLRSRIATHRSPVAGTGSQRGILPPLRDSQIAVLAALKRRSPQTALQLGVRHDTPAALEERGLVTRAILDGNLAWWISGPGLDELARRQQQGTEQGQ